MKPTQERVRSDVTSLWSAITTGRWVIVDAFELDGKRYLHFSSSPPDHRRARPLSEREAQVLACVARGHANKLIAHDLGLSESSVSAYLRRAAAKLGATSRVGLVRAYQTVVDRAA